MVQAFIPVEAASFHDLPDEAFVSLAEMLSSGVCPWSACTVIYISPRRWPSAQTFGKNRKMWNVGAIKAQLIKGTGLELLEAEDE